MNTEDDRIRKIVAMRFAKRVDPLQWWPIARRLLELWAYHHAREVAITRPPDKPSFVVKLGPNWVHMYKKGTKPPAYPDLGT